MESADFLKCAICTEWIRNKEIAENLLKKKKKKKKEKHKENERWMVARDVVVIDVNMDKTSTESLFKSSRNGATDSTFRDAKPTQKSNENQLLFSNEPIEHFQI